MKGTALLLVQVFLYPSLLEAQTPAWPMLRHDAQLSSRSPFIGPQELKNPIVTNVSQGIAVGLAIDTDGVLYVPSTGGEPKQTLCTQSDDVNKYTRIFAAASVIRLLKNQ